MSSIPIITTEFPANGYVQAEARFTSDRYSKENS